MKNLVNHGSKMEMALKEEVGKKIAQLRKEKRWSQDELAQKSGIGKSHIGRIELGRYSVGLDTLQKICDALEVTIELKTKAAE